MLTAPARRLRLLASSVVMVLATAGIVAVTGSPAAADPTVQIPCPSWARPGWTAQPLYVINSSPGFLTSESRVVVNELDTPSTATFTSQTSRTFGISATAGVTFTGLFGFLNANVSSTITSSTT